MSTLTTVVSGYPVCIEYTKYDIERCYIGDNSGYDVWKILDDKFKQLVFKEIQYLIPQMKTGSLLERRGRIKKLNHQD